MVKRIDNPLKLSPVTKKLLKIKYKSAIDDEKTIKTTPQLSDAVTRNIQKCIKNRCEIPNCNLSSQEVHHIKPRNEGGKHTYFNLIALCGFHHIEAKNSQISREDLKKFIKKRNLTEETCIRNILGKLKK